MWELHAKDSKKGWFHKICNFGFQMWVPFGSIFSARGVYVGPHISSANKFILSINILPLQAPAINQKFTLLARAGRQVYSELNIARYYNS